MKERTEKKEESHTMYMHMYVYITHTCTYAHIRIGVLGTYMYMYIYIHVPIHSCFRMFMFPYIHGIVYLATNNTCTIHTLYMCCDLHVCCSNGRGLGRAELMSELLTLIERVKKCADDLRLEETAYDEVRYVCRDVQHAAGG